MSFGFNKNSSSANSGTAAEAVDVAAILARKKVRIVFVFLSLPTCLYGLPLQIQCLTLAAPTINGVMEHQLLTFIHNVIFEHILICSLYMQSYLGGGPASG